AGSSAWPHSVGPTRVADELPDNRGGSTPVPPTAPGTAPADGLGAVPPAATDTAPADGPGAVPPAATDTAPADGPGAVPPAATDTAPADGPGAVPFAGAGGVPTNTLLVRADALVPCTAGTVIIVDPARRAGGKRTFDPAALQPPLPDLLAAYPGRDMAVKCAPGLDFDRLGWAGEVEEIGRAHV